MLADFGNSCYNAAWLAHGGYALAKCNSEVPIGDAACGTCDTSQTAADIHARKVSEP